jgi:2-oxoglutarate/2-oxoacid ferredoxin oxidoreductase subunit alpha
VIQKNSHDGTHKAKLGVIFYGSTSPAMSEAMEALDANHVYVDTLRIRAFPFNQTVADFIEVHDQVFVVEQNRDAQIRTLLVAELNVDPAKLMPVLHYDGTPITARFIAKEIMQATSSLNVTPLRKTAQGKSTLGDAAE